MANLSKNWILESKIFSLFIIYGDGLLLEQIIRLEEFSKGQFIGWSFSRGGWHCIKILSKCQKWSGSWKIWRKTFDFLWASFPFMYTFIMLCHRLGLSKVIFMLAFLWQTSVFWPFVVTDCKPFLAIELEPWDLKSPHIQKLSNE